MIFRACLWSAGAAAGAVPRLRIEQITAARFRMGTKDKCATSLASRREDGSRAITGDAAFAQASADPNFTLSYSGESLQSEILVCATQTQWEEEVAVKAEGLGALFVRVPSSSDTGG